MLERRVKENNIQGSQSIYEIPIQIKLKSIPSVVVGLPREDREDLFWTFFQWNVGV